MHDFPPPAQRWAARVDEQACGGKTVSRADPEDRPLPTPQTQLEPRVAGCILAGGAGARLGGAIKADIAIGGVRLIERVAQALRLVDPLLVATGRHGPGAFALPARAIAITDAPGVAGPLGGIAAAAGWLANEERAPDLMVSVAVDTPFFPADFVARALPLLDADTDVVVAAFGGQIYPTNALWRTSVLTPLRADFAARAGGGIKGLFGQLRVRPLPWPDSGDGDPFANVNTPADRATLEARAHTAGG